MKRNTLPNRLLPVAHAEFELIDARRRVERFHAVKDGADTWPRQHLPRHFESQRVVHMSFEKVTMALLQNHIAAIIHPESDQKRAHPAFDKSAPEFEAFKPAGKFESADEFLASLARLPSLACQRIGAQRPRFFHESLERDQFDRRVA